MGRGGRARFIALLYPPMGQRGRRAGGPGRSGTKVGLALVGGQAVLAAAVVPCCCFQIKVLFCHNEWNINGVQRSDLGAIFQGGEEEEGG